MSTGPQSRIDPRHVVFGVCGGLLVALAVLFAVTAFGLPLRQSGTSYGKSVFMLVWLAAIVASVVQRDLPGSFVWFSRVAGSACLLAALRSEWGWQSALGSAPASVMWVDAVLMLSAAGLFMTAAWWQQRRPES